MMITCVGGPVAGQRIEDPEGFVVHLEYVPHVNGGLNHARPRTAAYERRQLGIKGGPGLAILVPKGATNGAIIDELVRCYRPR